MPNYVVQKAMAQLNEARKALNGAKVLVVGVAYKPGVPDTRESPALTIIEALQKHGAEVDYFDPLVPVLALDNGTRMQSVALDRQRLQTSDLILITTDHDSPEYSLLNDVRDKVLDTRNALGREPATPPAAIG